MHEPHALDAPRRRILTHIHASNRSRTSWTCSGSTASRYTYGIERLLLKGPTNRPHRSIHGLINIPAQTRQQITMGQRVLRTEAAVPALMALAQDRLDALDAGGR